MRLFAASAIFCAILSGCTTAPTESAMPVEELATSVEDWRATRDEGLRKPDSWLTLVGLHFLNEGENPFGTGDDNTVVLPSGKAPERAGAFIVEGGEVRVRVDDGVEVTVGGEPIQEMPLVDDGEGKPTILAHGPLLFYLVERGGKLGIRVKDSDATTRTGFAGLEYFPVSADWAVQAQFERLAEARSEPIQNSIGQSVEAPVAGLFHFDKDGEHHMLELTLEGTEHYIMFGDATNGDSTYSGGRFIKIGDVPPDGPFLLNFNLAYNPPCVFTPFATCPRPTPENRLSIEVNAGEKMYDLGH